MAAGASEFVSIVIEWENVVLAEEARALEMLRLLYLQIAALPAAVNVTIVHDEATISRATIEAQVARATDRLKPQILSFPGANYYELKNAGASASSGDPIVFIDSDVIPDGGWLAALLRTLEAPEVQFVCGVPYIETGSFVGRAFALFWYLPLRPEDNRVHQVAGFYANNFAMRRALFDRFPFPPVSATRGAEQRLGRTFRAERIGMWRNTGATVSHPPPNGLRHIVVRALAQGRDRVEQQRGEGWVRSSLLGAPIISAGKFVRAARRIAGSYRAVGLPVWQIPVVFVFAFAYYALHLVGDLSGRLFPRWSGRRWQI